MTGKTVLVTGAAKGIGRGIAQRFLEGGWAVALFDIDCEGLATTAAELSACGRVLALEGDVAGVESARAAVFSTMEGFGRLDALVNNAGIEIGGRVDELSPEQWDRQLGVKPARRVPDVEVRRPAPARPGRVHREHFFGARLLLVCRVPRPTTPPRRG